MSIGFVGPSGVTGESADSWFAAVGVSGCVGGVCCSADESVVAPASSFVFVGESLRVSGVWCVVFSSGAGVESFVVSCWLDKRVADAGSMFTRTVFSGVWVFCGEVVSSVLIFSVVSSLSWMRESRTLLNASSDSVAFVAMEVVEDNSVS